MSIFSGSQDPQPPQIDTQSLQKAKTAYRNILAEAKNLFDKKDYVTARSKYNEAIRTASIFDLNITDAETGIVDCDAKIKEIVDQLLPNEKETNYKKWKAKGDDAFNKGNYNEAKEDYKKAQDYKNTNNIRNKIASCDKKLSPVAKFTMNKSNCIAPCKITFTNLSKNATTYTWNVGEKQEGGTREFRHTFNSAGKYSIRLVASKGSQNDTYEQFISIRIDLPQPTPQNTPNEIEIDEDLTLVSVGQGLGKRRILDQPNILILSDEDGIVAVDICVNKRGKVETAQFNSKLSTLAKKRLVSIAIRKSKDFWFEKNDYIEQCGVIIFKIKEAKNK